MEDQIETPEPAKPDLFSRISRNDDFVTQLVKQIVVIIKNKITHLDTKRSNLEEFLKEPDESGRSISTEERIKASSKHEEIAEMLELDRNLQEHLIEIATDTIQYKETQVMKEKQDREELAKQQFNDGFGYFFALKSLAKSQNKSSGADTQTEGLSESELDVLIKFNKLLHPEKIGADGFNSEKMVDHLLKLVGNRNEKIYSLDPGLYRKNPTYADIKKILDRFLSDPSRKRSEKKPECLRLPNEQAVEEKNSKPKKKRDSPELVVVEEPEIIDLADDFACEKSKNTGDDKENETEDTIKPKKQKKDKSDSSISTSVSEKSQNNITDDISQSSGSEEDLLVKEDVFYGQINLTRLEEDKVVRLKPDLTRLDYAYAVVKILFNKDELANGVIADIHGHSKSHYRDKMDQNRIEILRRALATTRFKLSSKTEKYNSQWERLRIDLNAKIAQRRSNKKKKIISEPQLTCD